MYLRESRTKNSKWISENTKHGLLNRFKRIQNKEFHMDLRESTIKNSEWIHENPKQRIPNVFKRIQKEYS